MAGDILWFGGIIKKNNIFLFENGSTMVGNVNRIDGILLLVLFVGFIAWTVSYALKERTEEDGTDEVIMLSKRKSAIFIVGGAIAIAVGGQVVVDSAKSLALAAGMSETLVGLTIVAMGTSLPELVTSAVAASKGEADLAIGNVVGSNLSNILLVLGLSAAISSVGVTAMNFVDIIVSLAATIIVFIVASTQRTIKKKEGIFLVIIYAFYMAYIICRQIYG